MSSVSRPDDRHDASDVANHCRRAWNFVRPPRYMADARSDISTRELEVSTTRRADTSNPRVVPPRRGGATRRDGVEPRCRSVGATGSTGPTHAKKLSYTPRRVAPRRTSRQPGSYWWCTQVSSEKTHVNQTLKTYASGRSTHKIQIGSPALSEADESRPGRRKSSLRERDATKGATPPSIKVQAARSRHARRCAARRRSRARRRRKPRHATASVGSCCVSPRGLPPSRRTARLATRLTRVIAGSRSIGDSIGFSVASAAMRA